MTDEEKSYAILKAWHNFVHKGEMIAILSDSDLNTLEISTTKRHWHFGQVDNEYPDGYSILLDELYNHFVRAGNEIQRKDIL